MTPGQTIYAAGDRAGISHETVGELCWILLELLPYSLDPHQASHLVRVIEEAGRLVNHAEVGDDHRG